MSIFPEIIAGYEAAQRILGDRPVSMRDPRHGPSAIGYSVAELMAAQPAAYSVEAYVLQEGINLSRNGRFGFDEAWQMVPYPVPHTDPGFAEQLAAVLLPVVDGMLAAAAEQRATETAQLGPGAVIEARDAVTEVTE